jgi:hypothetical protein
MKSRAAILVIIIILVTLAGVAYFRSGLLNLPSVPDDLTAQAAGLDGLSGMQITDVALMAGGSSSDSDVPLAKSALDEISKGNEYYGIAQLQEAVRRDPTNLVLGNTLRMQVMQLKHKWLSANAGKSEIALRFPEYLDGQPVQYFHELLKIRPCREAKLQLALALVDHMLLFPALEIKAPSSVESVEILSEILKDPKDACYVPALYARGLNYLYRPFNLVWPERISARPDAASTDIALAVAVGQKIGSGSDALKAELSLALGDAYAKEGKLNLGRSWWQIANNMARDENFRSRVFTRLHWSDEDVPMNLEETLQHQMEDLDNPLSDLRLMWR